MTHHPIKLADGTIDDSELSELATWIQSGSQLTKGPLTIEFERAFADMQGCEDAIFVNSGSSANLLMAYSILQSGRLKNRVAIAPAVSWVTTVAPLMQLGFEVKLCDCDRSDLGLDLEHLEKLCREHSPSLLFVVHVLGHANRMDEIQAICDRYGVTLMEDSCEALGSTYKDGRKLGTLATAGSYSFYYGHHISTIEGGMVMLPDKSLSNIMRSIRSHGWSRDIDAEERKRLASEYSVDEFRNLYTFYYPGFNLRSTDLQAYLGLSQIKKLDGIGEIRERNYQHYAKRLERFFVQTSESELVSSFAYGTLVENRMATFKHLQDNGVECRPLICGNIGQHPFWQKHYQTDALVNADIVHEKGIYLPNHANISSADVDRVCDLFLEVAVPAEDFHA